VGKGLNICGQGGVWQVMVMARQGAGELAQGASGASILSKRVVGGARVWVQESGLRASRLRVQ